MARASTFVLLLAAGLPAQLPVPGKTYWGKNGYIEYIAGSAPIVLAAPHGGYLKPPEIPDRTWGVTAQDRMTQQLAREVRRAVGRSTGRYPHLVLCHLHRSKLDANRDIREAAQGNQVAEEAWRDFHRFLDQAKSAVTLRWGRGHFYDLHGHGHPVDWIELGYALTAAELAKTDAQLRRSVYRDRSTIRALAAQPGVDFPEALRGATSLGGLLQGRGYRSVPSPADPSPKGRSYFSGGYNTRRHGSRDGGSIDGTQIEHSWMLRRSRAAHTRYADRLAASLAAFFVRYHGIDLASDPRITVRALDAHASEQGRRAALGFSRSGDVSRSRLVSLLVGGTATEGIDFTALPRTVTFPAGRRTVSLAVAALDDRLAEGWETLTVRVDAGAATGVPGTATVLIADDEGRPQVACDLALDAVAGGLTKDATAHGRDAALVPDAARGPRLVAGRHGKALSFDGIDDALRIRRFVYAPGGAFTLAFWFRASKRSSGLRYLFSHGTFGKPQSVSVYLSSSTRTLKTLPVFANARVTDTAALAVEGDFFDDLWHHYGLAVRSDALTRVWVDGKLRAEAFLAGDLLQPAGDLWLGARSDRNTRRFLQGALDDVRILSRPISEAELRDLFAWAPGRVRPVGPGCRGSHGVPSHTVTGPLDVGTLLALRLAAGPPSAPGLVAVGASATSWSRVPLPVDLGPFGAPGCFLRVAIDLPSTIVTTAAGSARLALSLPFDPALAGARMFSQLLLLDHSANRLGLVLSNALDIQLGSIR